MRGEDSEEGGERLVRGDGELGQGLSPASASAAMREEGAEAKAALEKARELNRVGQHIAAATLLPTEEWLVAFSATKLAEEIRSHATQAESALKGVAQLRLSSSRSRRSPPLACSASSDLVAEGQKAPFNSDLNSPKASALNVPVSPYFFSLVPLYSSLLIHPQCSAPTKRAGRSPETIPRATASGASTSTRPGAPGTTSSSKGRCASLRVQAACACRIAHRHVA